LILIPQGLAYSKLAGLPAINGLYAAIVPSFTYTVLGSSMQLAVGPVAVVSLLTSQIVTKYCAIEGTDLTTAQKSDPGLLLDITAQCCICVGIILTVMGVLNLGRLIHFVSHPVMSAFTSAAAWTIGLSQLCSHSSSYV
jgi:SulP family sulfate permease